MRIVDRSWDLNNAEILLIECSKYHYWYMRNALSGSVAVCNKCGESMSVAFLRENRQRELQHLTSGR